MTDSIPKTIAQVLGKMAASDAEVRREICEKHGAYDSRQFMRDRWNGCGACVEERQATDREAQQREMFEQQREAHARRLLKRAAIPPRFADRRLSNFVPHCDGATKALAIAQDYADNFDARLESGASLIFCGGVGAGKTHLAIGICHEVIARRHEAVFASVMGAVRSVKETYAKDSEITERDAIQNLIAPDLLVLDEMGVQFGSDTEKLVLFEIINGRYEAMKPTIVISNLAKDALVPFMGERVVDRLREGGGRLVAFTWPSFRKEMK